FFCLAPPPPTTIYTLSLHDALPISTVREEINSDSAQISGGAMTDREAINLSNILNNPLDLPLVVKEQYEVGPSLAQDAVDSGMKDRKSTRLNSSHVSISYAVFCLKK